MLNISEIKPGTYIQIKSEPYVIIWTQHVQMGRGGAILRTKIKNLITGAVLEKTFKGADKAEEANLTRGKANYLYKDNTQAYFMDNTSFEQFEIDLEIIGDKLNFLKEGTNVGVLYFNEKPINVEIPIKVDLEVITAPPGVRGDTAQGSVTKEVELETGAIIKAPIFIKKGDIVRINTEKGEYVERVKE